MILVLSVAPDVRSVYFNIFVIPQHYEQIANMSRLAIRFYSQLFVVLISRMDSA